MPMVGGGKEGEKQDKWKDSQSWGLQLPLGFVLSSQQFLFHTAELWKLKEEEGEFLRFRWLSGNESVCQHRRMRLTLWSGKIPHAARGTAKPMRRNYWAAVQSLGNHNYWSPRAPKNPCRNKIATANEKPTTTTREKPIQQWRSSTSCKKIK